MAHREAVLQPPVIRERASRSLRGFSLAVIRRLTGGSADAQDEPRLRLVGDEGGASASGGPGEVERETERATRLHGQGDFVRVVVDPREIYLA